MFLPISNTYSSLLSGVYRIILGNTEEQNSPLYPSLSTVDWNGNTVHLRVGTPAETIYNI